MPLADSSVRSGISPQLLAKEDLQALIDGLRRAGYRVVGPRLSQGAIVLDELTSITELPRGWSDEQVAGKYRLHRRTDDTYFGYNVGPHSWKQYLFPAQATVAAADRTSQGWELRSVDDQQPPLAFLGARACDLAAIAVQDRTFIQTQYADPIYRRRRAEAFIVAVDCGQAASTCFCTSMSTGPACRQGFDLLLTELAAAFLFEIGTSRGEALAAGLPLRPAEQMALDEAATVRQRAVAQVSKQLDTTDIRQVLMGNLEHPRWSQVAERCLSCANCTMVCPTCFCSSVREVTDLAGDHVERQREWDSCFNVDFSYLSGGIVRNQIRARYRQWLTHKLAGWIDQFDVSGCVGCGRCITWCPVGIDLTEEVAAIREEPA